VLDVIANGGTSVASGLTKSGAGTLILSGANTYSGATTLSGGTLVLASAGALGTGTLVLNGGTLTAGNNGLVLANPFSLTAGSVLAGTNFITFNGNGTLGGLVSLTVSGNTTATLHGSIGESTPSILTKLGEGTLVFQAGNTYSGETTISSGTASLGNSSGSAFGSGPVTVNYGAKLSGNGSFTGPLTLSGTISPGNSPGFQSTGSQVWNGFASYNWELNKVGGTKGADPGWDWLNINGTLTLTATSSSKFNLNLLSLTLGNTSGNVIDFNSSVNSSYTIASASGGIFGFDSSAFAINTTGFTNNLGGGTWFLSLGNGGTDLNLNFLSASAIPEPGTYGALAGLAALGLAAHRRRRRT
jgi:fibronectin-binding autotransporter adhesin